MSHLEHPHQCPYCPLVFERKTEVHSHISADHPDTHLDEYSNGHETEDRLTHPKPPAEPGPDWSLSHWLTDTPLK
jgi:hypothetical protein